MEMVAMESSLTSFTPHGLTLGILFMSSTTLSVLPLRKSIMFLNVLMISFSPLLMLYSNLMLFLGYLAWYLYLLIFLKFGLSFIGLFQLLLFLNKSFCQFLGEKSFPSLWYPGFIVLLNLLSPCLDAT